MADIVALLIDVPDSHQHRASPQIARKLCLTKSGNPVSVAVTFRRRSNFCCVVKAGFGTESA